MVKKQEQTVEIELNIRKNLRAQVRQAAKSWGISEQEFIHNALESRVRQESDRQHSDGFIRHGGKHLMGKYTGYEVTPDGKYYPAPTWVEQFEQLWAEQGAIQTLVNGVESYSEDEE